EQPGDGGLAVGAGDDDQFEFAAGIVVVARGDAGDGAADIADDADCAQRGCDGDGRDDGNSPALGGVGDVLEAVIGETGNGDEEIVGGDQAAVDFDLVDGHGRVAGNLDVLHAFDEFAKSDHAHLP